MNAFAYRLLSASLVATLAGVSLWAQIPEPKVSIVDNTFTCSGTPKFTFKVQSSFAYLGHLQEGEDGIDHNVENPSKKTNPLQWDSYFFADRTDPDSPKIFCIAILQMAHSRWSFRDDLHERLPEDRYLEKGRYKLGNTNFRTAIFVANLFTLKQLSFLIDHDIKVPRMFTTKQVEGTVTLTGSVKVCFTYAQDIRGLNDGFPTLTSLNDSQKAQLNDFISSANDLFDVH